jgi:hypothetical protein
MPQQFAFEKVPPASISKMEWTGELGEAFDTVRALAEGTVALSGAYWAVSRVARGIIDDSSVSGTERIQLINQVTEASLGIYAGNPNLACVETLGQSLERAKLMDRQVTQPVDTVTAYVTGRMEPLRQEAVAQLSAVTGSLLLVPLCHGGFVAGMQQALVRQRSAPDTPVMVYPVRLSRTKHSDRVPLVGVEELDMLTRSAQTGITLVYDEDVVTGDTMGAAIEYLREQIPGVPIVGGAAVDSREPNELREHGACWEKVGLPKTPLYRKAGKKILEALSPRPR